ncbi:MarR family winged helix-turn-helix transcriptional regulator [Microvirga sp. TS319]|uniref:MarR family winged helix-turn-helix transcriptional regulator n=1 Tax=Microvirga sp. TS319 TaxID=3241165 RepID=UPI00351A1D05
MTAHDTLDGTEAPHEGSQSHLDPLVEIRLWHNPCWFSFRINYLALHFNIPIYGWIEQFHGVTRPEFVVLYSVGLKAGIAAKNICGSTGFPKPTISRAIQLLLKRNLLRREVDPADQRSYVLHLTEAGRTIFDEAMPVMVERERTMLARLSPAERSMLSELLAKVVVDSPTWPTSITPEDPV